MTRFGTDKAVSRWGLAAILSITAINSDVDTFEDKETN